LTAQTKQRQAIPLGRISFITVDLPIDMPQFSANILGVNQHINGRFNMTKKSSAKDKIIEFRFNCPHSLREKMIKRLKELNFDRSEVMCEFLEEWLNETQELVKKSS